MTSELVSSLDGMTAEWLSALLSEAGVLDGGKVDGAELEPVSGGVMTSMVRARLRYSNANNAPSSVLIKYPSEDEGNLGIAQLMGLYELEVRFYKDVAPLLPELTTPTCYYAELDEETGRFALVLEDLSFNTKSGAMMNTVTADECSSVFGELVKFQAPLWNSPALSRFDWLYSPARTLAIFDAIPAGLAPFLERFGNALDPDYVNLFESVLPVADQWARSWQAPKVLQHGEFRSGNILYGAATGAPPVTVIDFQTVRVGPPGIDPAYFMGASMPVEQRRVIEPGLIREYHQRLVSAGVEGFDWDACWKSYCEGAMYGVYLLVGMAGQVESSEQNDQVILGLVQRLAAMALDLESAKVAGLV
jgi:Phosphotransferase enzyme family